MRKAVFLAAALLCAGCDGSNLFTEVPLPTFGTMSAKIDGTPWVARDPQAFIDHDVVIIRGVDSSGVLIELSVPLIEAHKIRFPPVSVARAFVVTDFTSWISVPDSGVLEVTTLTSDHAAGSFAFTAEPVTKKATLRRLIVTEGQFNVTFRAASLKK